MIVSDLQKRTVSGPSQAFSLDYSHSTQKNLARRLRMLLGEGAIADGDREMQALGINKLVTAVTFFALMMGVRGIAAAVPYPIPFDTEPDWHGVSTQAIVPVAIVKRTPVLKHKLVIIELISKKPLSGQDAAARLAYDNLFINVKHLPSGPEYVVMMIYGPRTSSNVAPEYAYIFARDFANRWQPRIISEKELDAIESAMGRSPNL